jgi:hypothetical protein
MTMLATHLSEELVGNRSIEREWGQKIVAAWQQSVTGILECGRLLIQAKAALTHGRFEAMIEAEGLFSARTAQRLMEIANDGRLTNPTHVSLLPSHWGTLHALSKLDPDEFEDKLADGTIHPDMTRAAAASKSKPKRKSNPVASLVRLADRLAEISAECELPSEIGASIMRVQKFAYELKDKQAAERKQEKKEAGRKPSANGAGAV